MNKNFTFYVSVFTSIAMLCAGKINAEQQARHDVQAVILMKLLKFHRSIDKNGDITIYVMGSNEFTNEMKKSIGRKIGMATITKVEGGSGLPRVKPAALYVGNMSSVPAAMQYCRDNKIISMTGIPGAVEKGITLGVVVADKKPKILLNLGSSKAENINWNPAILKVAKTVK